jgi:hypothetical protein
VQAAYQSIEQVTKAGYDVIGVRQGLQGKPGNNCMDHTIKILTTYGAGDMPNPTLVETPDLFFQFMRGPWHYGKLESHPEKVQPAPSQHPILAINSTQGPPGTHIPVLGDAHKAVTFLTQMITLAMQNGGVGQEAQLDVLKQQIEALPKPKRGDRKAARLQNDKGLEVFKKEQYEQALQFFLAAYQLDGSDVEVVNNIGMAYLKTGNLSEAARYLGGALSLALTRAAA